MRPAIRPKSRVESTSQSDLYSIFPNCHRSPTVRRERSASQGLSRWHAGLQCARRFARNRAWNPQASPICMASSPTAIGLRLFVGSVQPHRVFQGGTQDFNAPGDSPEIARGIHEPVGFVENLVRTTGVLAGFLEGLDLLVQPAKLNPIIRLLQRRPLPDDHNPQHQKYQDDGHPQTALHGWPVNFLFGLSQYYFGERPRPGNS